MNCSFTFFTSHNPHSKIEQILLVQSSQICRIQSFPPPLLLSSWSRPHCDHLSWMTVITSLCPCLLVSLGSRSGIDHERRFEYRKPIWEMIPRHTHRETQKWEKKQRRKWVFIIKQATTVSNWVSIILMKSGTCNLFNWLFQGWGEQIGPLYIFLSPT